MIGRVYLLRVFLALFFAGSLSVDSVKAKCIFDEPIFDFDMETAKEILSFKTSHHTFITVLKDRTGKKIVVKQETRKPLYWHLSIARDKLGAQVAASVGIYANRVEIVPARCSFLGKLDTRFPATVHEFVPGVSVHLLSGELERYKVIIKQALSPHLGKSKRGLTRNIIHNMAFHADLPCIVAFDTFIANSDRHNGNFFYDVKSDHYYAIDLESSFKDDLAVYACGCIELMLNDKDEHLSGKELKGLLIYRDTLNALIEFHDAQSLYKQLEAYALQGGIRSALLRSTVLGKLAAYKVAIGDNYDSCKRLLALLDKLLNKHDRGRLDNLIAHLRENAQSAGTYESAGSAIDVDNFEV